MAPPQLRIVPRRRLTPAQAQRVKASIGRTLAACPDERALVEDAIHREIDRATEGAEPAWRFTMASDEFLPALFLWAASEAPRSAKETNRIIAEIWPSVDRRDGRITLTNRQIAEKLNISADDVGRCLKAMTKAGFLNRFMVGREAVYAINPWLATKLGPSDAAAARQAAQRPRLATENGSRIEDQRQPELITNQPTG